MCQSWRMGYASARIALEKQEKNSHIQQQYKAALNFSAWLFAFLCEVALAARFL